MLHAYPNGELQFENYETSSVSLEVVDGKQNKRYLKRTTTDADNQAMTEKNLESLARAMSMGATSVKVKSSF